jgi:hypothetical protein
MPYTRTTWQDFPDTTTPITAANLNNIENGLDEAQRFDYYHLGQPSPSVRTTLPLVNATTASTPTSGVLHINPIVLMAGDTITHLAYATGITAGATITQWWFALYDAADNLVGQTAAQGSAALPASTPQKLALASPYPVMATGLFYVALYIVATTRPTIVSATTVSGAVPTDAIRSVLFPTGAKMSRLLTHATSATAPATLSGATTGTVQLWAAAFSS